MLANISPIERDGKVTGYVSVRTRPAREDVEAAQHLYAEMQTPTGANRWRIVEGTAVRNTLWQPMGRFLPQTLKHRLAVAIVVGTLLVTSLGVLALSGVQHLRGGLEAVFAQAVVPIKLLKTVSDSYATEIPAWLHQVESGQMPPGEATAKIEAAQATGKAQWTAFRQIAAKTTDRALLTESETMLNEFDAALTTLRGQLAAGAEMASTDQRATLDQQAVSLSRRIAELIDRQMHLIAQHYGSANDESLHTRNVLFAGIGLFIVLLAAAGWRLFNEVVYPLRQMAGQMTRIANGDLGIAVHKQRNDEIGEMVDAFKRLYVRQGYDVAEAHRQATESLRIKVALDNVSACVMMVDNQRRIIYMNKAVEQLMRVLEPRLREDIPGFQAAHLIGQPVDVLLGKSGLAYGATASTQRATVELGGHTLNLIASPVIDAASKRLGTTLEWTDRTAELAVERSVASIVNAAAEGDFSRRVEVDDVNSFLGQLGNGINQVLQTSSAGLKDLAVILKALEAGDLSLQIEGRHQGTLAELINHANDTVAHLRDMVGSIGEASEAILSAAREIAQGSSDMASRTEHQSRSIEQTAARTRLLTETVKQSAESARQASVMAQDARGVVDSAGEIVNRLVANMQAVGNSSAQISRIVEVIDGIAFQTNILAINAAVEAARAGSHGKGFAVVASEVRNLARRSSEAAGEITGLITTSGREVEQARGLVDATRDAMQGIVQATRQISDLMADISAASVEQANGIDDINRTLTELDGITQQNAAMGEQAASAAQSLERQAARLHELIGRFRLDAQPSAPAAPRPPARLEYRVA